MSQNRQPKGIPVGGQFAASSRAEAAMGLVHTPPVTSLTEDEFDQRYGIVEGPDGSSVWENDPTGEVPANRVWTVIEGDDGGQFLLPGSLRVNRLGYVVSERPWQDENIEVTWLDADNDDDNDGFDNDGNRLTPADGNDSAGRVTLDWEPDGSGSYVASSSSGWGTRATIVPPEHGDGESYFWEVRQGGWTWDGREQSLELAKSAAASNANTMLNRQEDEPGGFDWDADDDDDDALRWM